MWQVSSMQINLSGYRSRLCLKVCIGASESNLYKHNGVREIFFLCGVTLCTWMGNMPYAFTSAASCEVRVRVRDRSLSPACWISWRFLSTCGSSDTASVSAASCSACCRSSPKPSASIPLKRVVK